MGVWVRPFGEYGERMGWLDFIGGLRGDWHGECCSLKRLVVMIADSGLAVT